MKCSRRLLPPSGWWRCYRPSTSSRATEAEWRAFYAKDPSGEHEFLLPVRVGDVEPPGLLTTRIYVDLVGRDANSARAALLMI